MRVIIESPFKGKTPEESERNIRYARACMRDSFLKGEFPFASHLLYTQKGILDDGDPDERLLGINAGLDWGAYADKTVVYEDLGISEGMTYGIERADREGRLIEYRKLKCHT